MVHQGLGGVALEMHSDQFLDFSRGSERDGSSFEFNNPLASSEDLGIHQRSKVVYQSHSSQIAKIENIALSLAAKCSKRPHVANPTRQSISDAVKILHNQLVSIFFSVIGC